ncbi:MAG: ABC transporter substrate-binding protein, partial [Polyangiales bacterium]
IVECTGARACVDAHGGEAWTCSPDKRCVAVASEDCKIALDAKERARDDIVWIGAMFPRKGEHAIAFGDASGNAVEAAREDFARVVGGLPSRVAGRPARPLGVVSCDDSVAPERVAHHLVNDVGVPAVIGFHLSREVIDLASTIFIPSGTLAFATLDGGAMVTRVPHPVGSPRLVLRNAVSTTQTTRALAALIADPRAIDRGARPDQRPLRVAIVRASDAFGIALADDLSAALRLDGKPAIEQPERYRDVVFDPDSARSKNEAARKLVAFSPSVIVFASDEAIVDELLAPTERDWPRDVARPLWLTGNAIEGERFFAFLGRDADRRHRFLGLTTPTSKPANVRFAARYNQSFTPEVSAALAPAAPYDAFYAIAYAAYAVGDAPLNGVAIARAMQRIVPPGERVEVGPAHILDALSALHDGRSIDLDGASSGLDFDLATGEAPMTFAVMCVSVDASGRAIDDVESGLFVDGTRGAVTGSRRCP